MKNVNSLWQRYFPTRFHQKSQVTADVGRKKSSKSPD